MKCQKCDKDLSEGVRFCVYCGNRVVKECPGCKKIISADLEICEFCNLNIPVYEDNKRLLEEGKALDEKMDYEGAKAIYEKIKGPEILEASKLLEEVTRKLQIIYENRAKAEEFMRSKKWSKATHCFTKLQKLLPDDEYAASGLKSIEARANRRIKKVWIGIAGLIIIVAGISFYLYTNTVYCLAKKGLRSLLESENLEIRNSAALIIGWKGDKSGISTLRLLANSGDPRKSIYSLSVLLKLGDPNAIQTLRKILREGNVAERVGASCALAEFGDTAIVPELASYLSVANEDLRIASSVLLFNFGYSLGIPVLEKALRDSMANSRFKALYALYWVGDKKMLAFHEQIWLPLVKELLWDKIPEVKLLSAFLLNQFGTTLTPQDSIVIEQVLWKEYMDRTKGVAKVEDISRISAFYIAKGIITRKGDEDISEFAHLAKEAREKCTAVLSRIELHDETVILELMRSLDSTNKYERFCAALSLVKSGNKNGVPVLKELLRDKDETFRLTACKLVFEFI